MRHHKPPHGSDNSGQTAGTALFWSTALKRNSNYFVVERADDSPDNFRAIGRVQGAGITPHSVRLCGCPPS